MNALDVVREIELLEKKVNALVSIVAATENDMDFAHIEFIYLEDIKEDLNKQRTELKKKLEQTEVK